MESVKETVSEATKLIPEGYVDLIRRVVPGTLLLVIANAMLRVDVRIGLKDISVQVALVALIFSYFVGLVLDSVSDILTKPIFMWWSWRGFDKQSSEAEAVANPDDQTSQQASTPVKQSAEAKDVAEALSLKSADVNRPEHWWQYSGWKMPGLFRMYVIQHDPIARLVLPKLVAEEFLLRNSMTGLIGMLLTVIACWLFNIPEVIERLALPPKTICIGLLVTLIPVSVAAFHRSARTAARTWEWFHLVRGEEVKEKPATQQAEPLQNTRC